MTYTWMVLSLAATALYLERWFRARELERMRRRYRHALWQLLYLEKGGGALADVAIEKIERGEEWR